MILVDQGILLLCLSSGFSICVQLLSGMVCLTLNSMFSVKSGVRLGEVCSGWLFKLCINELIFKLKDSG